jgi:hypothetical protein
MNCARRRPQSATYSPLRDQSSIDYVVVKVDYAVAKSALIE